MGQYSFTDATNKSRSIAQCSSEHPDSQETAYLLLPGGKRIAEPAYDGYGYFGGTHAFEWLAQANGLSGGAEEAIKLFYDQGRYPELLLPIKITYDPTITYEAAGASVSCPFQGLPPRPDKAIAMAAGVDLAFMDEDIFEDVDFSDPSSILAAKLTNALTDNIPNRHSFDETTLDDPAIKKILMDIVLSSDDVTALLANEENLPPREDMESLITLAITDMEFDGAPYSLNVFSDAQIYAKEALKNSANLTPPHSTPYTEGGSPKIK
jgi:hypothetical protein